MDMGNRFKEFVTNCEACGTESFTSDLSTVKLSGFKSVIRICNSCKDSDPESHYKTAANVIKDIISISNSDISPEDRINQIKMLLGE